MPPLSVGEEEKGVMEGRECSSEVRAAFHQSPSERSTGEILWGNMPQTTHNASVNIYAYAQIQVQLTKDCHSTNLTKKK